MISYLRNQMVLSHIFTSYNFFFPQDQVKALSADLSGLENELDAMKPPGRDVKTVRGQQDELSKFIKKVSVKSVLSVYDESILNIPAPSKKLRALGKFIYRLRALGVRW